MAKLTENFIFVSNKKSTKVIEINPYQKYQVDVQFLGLDHKKQQEWPLTKKHFIKGLFKINFDTYYFNLLSSIKKEDIPGSMMSFIKIGK